LVSNLKDVEFYTLNLDLIFDTKIDSDFKILF
jgi:hypothetical protein